MNSINIVTKTPTSPAILEDIDITNTVNSNTLSPETFSSDSGALRNAGSKMFGISITKIVIILIILAFLGFNVFII